MATHPHIRALAQRIKNLEEQALRRKQPTLGFSSIDDGAITSVDEDGNLKMIIGKQYDNTQASTSVNGPVPPVPDGLTAIPALEGVVIRWAGTFVDDEIVPLDFTRVEVHASLDPGFTAEYSSTLIATFETPRGGEVYAALQAGEHTIKLVTRNLSGNRSDASVGVAVTPEPISQYIPTATDGLAPSSSPTPQVTGGIGAFLVRWVPPSNPDPLRFQVHVSDTPGFTPDETTLVDETTSYSMTVRALPGTDPESGQPVKFEYSTEEDPKLYYFKVIAMDSDGNADPGLEASGELFQITGPDVAATTIRGENIIGRTLTGEHFVGQIVMGSTITTGVIDPETGEIVGARVELGPDGFAVYGADGSEILQIPLDSSGEAFIRANFEMISAQVLDNFTLYGNRNQIATDSSMYLADGVTAPDLNLSITYDYNEVTPDRTTSYQGRPGWRHFGSFSFNPNLAVSIAWNSTWSKWEILQQRSDGVRAWSFNSDGTVATHPDGGPWVYDFPNRTKCTSADGAGGLGMLFKWSGDGNWYIAADNDYNRIPNGWILEDTASRYPCLGWDDVADQWMIVQNNGGGSGRVHVRRFTTVAGEGFPQANAQGTFQCEAGSGWSSRINGVVYGRQIGGGVGPLRYVHGVDQYVSVSVYDDTGAQKNVNGSYEEWNHPDSMVGFTHDGTNFVALGTNGKIYRYTNWNWPEASAMAWVGISAYDSDTAGDQANPHPGQTAGQHETPVGALTSFEQRRRADMNITLPKTLDSGMPDDPDKWRVYYARSTGRPTGAQLKLLGTGGDPATNTWVTTSSDPTGVAPAGGLEGEVTANNNFPGGSNPGSIYSDRSDAHGPLNAMRGDGSGRGGPYRWDSNGNAILRTETLTPTHPDIRIGSMTLVRTPDGLVFCEGDIDVDVNIGTDYIDTGMRASADFRPLSTAFRASAYFDSGGKSYRYRIDTNGKIYFQQSGVDPTYASLDTFWRV